MCKVHIQVVVLNRIQVHLRTKIDFEINGEVTLFLSFDHLRIELFHIFHMDGLDRNRAVPVGNIYIARFKMWIKKGSLLGLVCISCAKYFTCQERWPQQVTFPFDPNSWSENKTIISAKAR